MSWGVRKESRHGSTETEVVHPRDERDELGPHIALKRVMERIMIVVYPRIRCAPWYYFERANIAIFVLRVRIALRTESIVIQSKR
jgi:hypothetical protein